MKEKKEDRRINRTRRLMQEALMALIVEKGYEAATVQDILDKADVGRSTFYAHFRDKDDLLLSGFDHLRALFEQQQQALKVHQGGSGAEFNMILELFRHIGQHHKLYKAIAGKQSGEMILKYLHRYLYDMMIGPHRALVRNSTTPPPVPIEAATHWIVSSLLSLMIWWLENNMPFPPERMDEMFRRLTMPGIEAALGRKGHTRDRERISKEKKDHGAKAFYNLFANQEHCPEES